MNCMYEQRLKRLRDYLKREQIDIALITNPTNIYYFSGFCSDPHERFMALVVDVEREQTFMIVPSLDLEAAEQYSVVRDMIPCSDSDNPFILLNAKIGSKRIGTIGLEKKAFSVHRLERLQELFSGVNTNDIEEFIGFERLIKSDHDLVQIRRAIAITEEALEAALRQVCVGMTELDLTAELEYRIRKLGGDKPAFETIILTGKRSCLPHGKPGPYPIMESDFLLVDFGVYAGGFCSDITRTFVIGEGTKKQEEIYEIVLESNLAAIEKIKIGTPYGHIDRAGREVIAARGYGAYFNNRIGHGLGLDFHEIPSIHGENTLVVQPGHVFTIEPGIYLPAIGGVRIEDDICVHSDGKVEVLTTYPKQLRRL